MTKRDIMISNVSWGLYFAALGPILFLYYAVVLLLFFRSEIQSLFEPKPFRTAPTAAANLKVHSNASEGSVIEGMETVVEDLQKILHKAGKDADKQQLLQEINTRLAGYNGLRHKVFQPAIINYLINNAQTMCGVSFSEQELVQGWADLPR
jgi:hypothetical protein